MRSVDGCWRLDAPKTGLGPLPVLKAPVEKWFKQLFAHCGDLCGGIGEQW